MLNIEIDGKAVQVAPGSTVMDAANQVGAYIPHFCYHKKLSIAANCRMCLVQVEKAPKPMPACATPVTEGMKVFTASDYAKKAQQSVMEFLLINHPLDCPICDQAGECRLQEFSVEYGNGESRFLENKVKKPKNEELGPRVTLDAERCVLCSRCIRFMKEVANDDVLGFTERGSFTTIGCHPDKTLDSNYSLNTVDICPVGALTSTDFRFKMRVWFLKETKTIDVNCGTGCNIIVGSRDNVIYRITPRENNDVNSVWLPDSHRLNFKYLASPDRLKLPTVKGEPVEWRTAIAIAAQLIKAQPADAIAVIASGRMTNEELYLAKRLVTVLGVKHFDIVPRKGKADGILISEDRNPNTKGAQRIGLASGKLKEIAEGVKAGAIKCVITLGEDLVEAGVVEESSRATVIAMDILRNKTTGLAAVVLPACGWAEKRGSMINVKGRLQRLNQAIAAPGQAHDDWEILRDLIQSVSGTNGIYMIEDVFKAMAADVPEFAGLSLSKIGDLGLPLPAPKPEGQPVA